MDLATEPIPPHLADVFAAPESAALARGMARYLSGYPLDLSLSAAHLVALQQTGQRRVLIEAVGWILMHPEHLEVTP